jgi:hypothetical protein
MGGARGGRRRAPLVLAIALAFPVAGLVARAHVVYGTTTVRLLTLQSDLVARVRILDPDEELRIEDPAVRESVVVAAVLEPFKGSTPEKLLRFVQHGHGVAKYETGEEIALFAQRIERSRELGESPIAERIHWVSVQEAGAKFALDAHTRAAYAEAVRAYAQLERLPPDEQLDALRRITLELLASPHPQLASSAVRDVVLSADAPLLTAEDLPLLEPLLASPKTAIGVRVALLSELGRRGLVDAPPRWAELLRTTSGSERFAVVRAVAAQPSEPVTQVLVTLLASDDPLLVAAAAISLGAPGNEAAVAPLAALLDANESRVRVAAIRGLGRIGTSGARTALAKAATAHPDAPTRRRAGAELKLLDGDAKSAPRAAPQQNASSGPGTPDAR